MKKIFKCSQYIFIITVIVNCSFFLTACVNNENLQFNPKVSDFSSSSNTLSQGTESEQSEQTDTKVTDFADLDEKNPAYIHVFAAEDVIVEPQITELILNTHITRVMYRKYTVCFPALVREHGI